MLECGCVLENFIHLDMCKQGKQVKTRHAGWDLVAAAARRQLECPINAAINAIFLKPCFCLILGVFGMSGMMSTHSTVESHCLSVSARHTRPPASRVTASAYILRDFTQVRQASQCCPFAPDASRAILASPRHVVLARHGTVQLNFMRAQKTS